MSWSNLSAPKWMIFAIDVSVSICSTITAYFLRFNFDIPDYELVSMYKVIPYVILIRALTFVIAGTYAEIMRYTSTQDIQRVFLAVLSGSLIFCLTNLVTFKFFDEFFLIPFSIVIIEFLATTFITIAYRFFIKVAYYEIKNTTKERRNILIYGAGEAGLIAKRTLERDAGSKYRVLGFIDDNIKKKGRKLEGVRICHISQLEDMLTDNEVDHTIISIQDLGHEKLNEITETCLKYNTKVLNVPPVAKWINGELSFKQIKTVRIEDLLGRDSIKLDVNNVEEQIQGRVILVTGAAGSIGSELVRQISKFNPKKLIMLDQAESPLYDIEIEMAELNRAHHCEVVIGDISNKVRLENVIKTYRPEVIFHAAAYKHVPMMEDNPSEALRTNVQGTRNLADLAVQYKVKRFVMISTDKAVNPTNVMGTSKRIAEMYTQGLNCQSETNFITTRFGNVLGSNGSVIPLFRRQIEAGGPITVTHPEVTRYFMTIPEATALVLEAGAMGKGGEIYIFDMGESVKIIDLAKKMVKLSRLQLGKDIQIIYTGLRPGEKLYEELLTKEENTMPTHHPQIMIAKVAKVDFEALNKKMNELISLFEQQDNQRIVKLMKEIVPEFRSKNSVFEELDA